MRKFLALSLVALMSFGATIVPDSYDKLFLKNEGVTTSFVDSSTANPKTITANGNATQLSLPAAFSGKRTAGFFNENAADSINTDYLIIPNSTDFNFGTGNFSVTFYVNHNFVKNEVYLDLGNGYSSNGLLIGKISGNFRVYVAGSLRINQAWVPTIGTWYKINVTRTGTDITFSVNDSVTGTGTSNQDMQTGSNVGQIGHSAGYNTFFGGWMKNLTIVKGTTTVLDMRFDSPATSPLAPAIAFDGTGDYLTVPNGGDFDVGTGDFTIRASVWVPSGLADTSYVLFDSGSDSSKGIKAVIGAGSSTAMGAIYLNGSGTPKLTSNGSPVSLAMMKNAWNYFVFERSSGYLRIYLNGACIGFTADTTNITANSAVDARVGNNIAGTAPLNAYVREFEFKNSAIAGAGGNYISVPQTGYTVDSNTKLYIKGNEANGTAGTSILDSETTPKVVTCVNDAKIKYTESYLSCVFKDETGKFPYPVGSAKVDFFSAFGGGVGWFGANGDLLTFSDSTDFANYVGAFTQEGYCRLSSVGASEDCLWDTRNGDASAAGLICFKTSNVIKVFQNNAARITGATTLLVNKWYHVALVGNGGADGSRTIILYLDGVQEGSTYTNNYNLTDQKLGIGGHPINKNLVWHGLLDNIRISKGIARYTATFNPPEDVVQTGSKRKKASSWWNFF